MAVSWHKGIVDPPAGLNRKRNEPIPRKIRYKLLQGLTSTMAYTVQRIPENASYGLANIVGTLTYYACGKMRANALNHMRIALGEDDDLLHKLTLESFIFHTRSIVEVLRSTIYTPTDMKSKVFIRGIEHLDSALAKGNGAILLSAHYGNWEFIGMRISADGYRLNLLVRKQAVGGIDEILNHTRTKFGAKIIHRGDNRGLLRCLRSNEVIGILADQNEAAGGVFTDFFGKPAATATGPAVLSLRTGAPIVPVFINRNESNYHNIRLQPPIEFTPTGNMNNDIISYTTAMNKVIERQIASNPVEWLWIHKRWKRKPAANNE